METGLNMLIKQESLIEWAREKSLPYKELMSYYRCAMMEVETKFKVLSEDFSVKYDRNPIQSIKLRLKSPDSIIDKLSRNSWDISIDSIEKNLNDVAGVRVICSYQSDVYELADALLMQDDVELIARKDYIANPKPNGYRSLHLIIAIPIFLHNRKKMMKVEIQIRTLAMDWWASLEHDMKYKKDLDFSDQILRELHECAELSDAIDRRMEYLNQQCEKL
ncbi:MAG: GTP pyrophosphokinase family protein [Firmicutes bacterium]|nr:GTP pyrophosphokinase family protein [Bacillota bacterium]MBQ2455776.1 GTP pyrophosphokinase family protein [Bacillota bacterium]MBQ4234651.1 GTP pyrophosphokinase family protein [Bacillota bacterium]MBQ5436767.1 GTP pyrophosphokinase family protein [Bacillota bacterium]MBQ6261564.1 GTP pyrophosphokinase family protein [Bacillota bacterium]